MNDTSFLRACNQSLIPSSLSAFVLDRCRHIWMFTLAESSKMDSCHRRCPANCMPSRGLANGFSKEVFDWRISTSLGCGGFWTAILASCTILNLPAYAVSY